MRRQELEAVFVGPIPQAGLHRIVFQADAPNTELIEDTDILGSTVIFLTCSYREQVFIRIGYYVNNEYDLPEMNENPPEVVDIPRVMRNILADSPRVTRFDIKWDQDAEMAEDSREASQSQSQSDAAAAAAAAPMQPPMGGQPPMQPMGGAMHADASAAPMQPMDQPGAMHADPSMGGAPMDTQTSAMMGGEQVMAA